MKSTPKTKPKIDKTWSLPKPELKNDKYIWKSIARLGSVVPWGYEQDPDNSLVLHPIPDMLVLLEEGKDHLKKFTFREVADWLTSRTGVRITGDGLRRRLDIEQRNRRNVAEARTWQRKAEEARREAERLEKYVGANRFERSRK